MMTIEQEIALREASIRLIKRTPGAHSLNDVERLTGSPVGDALAEESGLSRELVWLVTGL